MQADEHNPTLWYATTWTEKALGTKNLNKHRVSHYQYDMFVLNLPKNNIMCLCVIILQLLLLSIVYKQHLLSVQEEESLLFLRFFPCESFS